jgi:hypothetical protein
LKLRLQQTLACLCQETMIIGKQNATTRFLFSHKKSPEERLLNTARN